jgi:hypothetical protein
MLLSQPGGSPSTIPPKIQSQIALTATDIPETEVFMTPTATVPWPTYDIPEQWLIDLCFPSVEEGTPVPIWFRRCSEFTASHDGRYLGYFFGRDFCGRNLIVLDLSTGQPAYQSEMMSGHWFEFLSNGKLLIAAGHCEGGGVTLYDLRTGDSRFLGGEGYVLWNEQRTAFAVRSMPHIGFTARIWGYNVPGDYIFLPEPATYQYDNHMLWTPDGSHLIFQHRDSTRDKDAFVDSLPSGREIMRVNAYTGASRVLAAVPEYDFHLCEGVRSTCDRWYGDWIQIRKLAYEPQQLDLDVFQADSLDCLIYGIDCEGEPELLALNWRTGELIPWNEHEFSTPTTP